MTVFSFFARSTQAELPSTFIEAERIVKAHAASADESCRTTNLCSNTGDISDEAREELIEVYSRHVEEFMSKAVGPDRATWLSYAQSAMHRRDALIRGRSAAQVRSLEIKRGLI